MVKEISLALLAVTKNQEKNEKVYRPENKYTIGFVKLRDMGVGLLMPTCAFNAELQFHTQNWRRKATNIIRYFVLK